MRVKVEFEFPFTSPLARYGQDTNLLLDIAEFLVQHRDKVASMKEGGNDPLTAERVVHVARLIGRIAEQALDQSEREQFSRLSPELREWLQATRSAGAASPSS